MTRIIEVEKCSDCLFRVTKVGEIVWIDKCDKTNTGFDSADLDVMNKTGFPEWCPLKVK